jgi:hypothetical protein
MDVMTSHRPPAALAALLATVLVLAVPTGDAAAHGGRRVLQTTAGPYRIEATIARAGELVDETVVVADAVSGRPVGGAAVALVLEEEHGQAAGPFLAARAGDAYEVRYPRAPDGRWTVLIEVRSSLGDATARHPYQPPPGGLWTGRAAVLINALVVVALVAAVFLIPRLGRRPGGTAPRGEQAARS